MLNRSEKETSEIRRQSPDIKMWSLEAFGVFLRHADYVDQSIFPLSIGFPKSHSFRLSVDKLLGTSFSDRFIEHLAVIATNDVGDLMPSKAIERGNHASVYFKKDSAAMHAYLQTIPLPSHWRRLGTVHNHPRWPYGKIGYMIEESMTSLRFSGDDIYVFYKGIALNSNVDMVVTPGGYGILLASKQTLEFFKGNPDFDISERELKKVSKDPKPLLEKLGIAYYGCSSREEVLKRLI